jgi:hypothetical protein
MIILIFKRYFSYINYKFFFQVRVFEKFVDFLSPSSI